MVGEVVQSLGVMKWRLRRGEEGKTLRQRGMGRGLQKEEAKSQ